MPASAGVQATVGWKAKNLDSRVRGNDEKLKVSYFTFYFLTYFFSALGPTSAP